MRVLAEAIGSMTQAPEFLPSSHVRTEEQASLQQLSSLVEQIFSATNKSNQLVQGRTDAELTTRLEAGSWSVAECLDHLAQTTRAFLPAMANAVTSAPSLTTKRSLRTGMLARVFVRNLEPPYRLHFKVLGQLVPQHQNFDAARNGFSESQSELLDLVRACAGVAIDQVKIQSPVYARFSYNVYGALRMLAAHQRRHLWQIEQILKALDRQKSLAKVA